MLFSLLGGGGGGDDDGISGYYPLLSETRTSYRNREYEAILWFNNNDNLMNFLKRAFCSFGTWDSFILPITTTLLPLDWMTTLDSTSRDFITDDLRNLTT
jgi:hypothetical protein